MGHCPSRMVDRIAFSEWSEDFFCRVFVGRAGSSPISISEGSSKMDLLVSGWGIWTKAVRGCLFDDDGYDEDGNPDCNGVGVLILGISVGSEVESNFMPKCCVIASSQVWMHWDRCVGSGLDHADGFRGWGVKLELDVIRTDLWGVL